MVFSNGGITAALEYLINKSMYYNPNSKMQASTSSSRPRKFEGIGMSSAIIAYDSSYHFGLNQDDIDEGLYYAFNRNLEVCFWVHELRGGAALRFIERGPRLEKDLIAVLKKTIKDSPKDREFIQQWQRVGDRFSNGSAQVYAVLQPQRKAYMYSIVSKNTELTFRELCDIDIRPYLWLFELQ
ncbi:hypothetical protein C8J56DRAFT_1059155 [Mycena floridula]|nr:hypothetical protein C8J56DRAFT_1059155 [Mycena floridula]